MIKNQIRKEVNNEITISSEVGGESSYGFPMKRNQNSKRLVIPPHLKGI